MTVKSFIASAAILLGCAAASSAQSVSLQFDKGLVNLTAQDAPLRTILAEWARLGGTRIVNGDKVTGGPVTLELKSVPERKALETLLRSVAGYVITPREAGGAGASMFGGVMILATSAAPRTTAPVTFSSGNTPAATAAQRVPVPVAVSVPDDDQDDDRAPGVRAPANPFTAAPGQAGSPVVVRPGVPPFVAGQQPAQPPVQRPATAVTTLPGTSRPGEITPVPQQDQNQR